MTLASDRRCCLGSYSSQKYHNGPALFPCCYYDLGRIAPLPYVQHTSGALHIQSSIEDMPSHAAFGLDCPAAASAMMPPGFMLSTMALGIRIVAPRSFVVS